MNQWMQVAFDAAVEGMLLNDGGPFGALIVKDGKIIAIAHNEVLKTSDPTAHAEINVIRKASQLLKSFDLSSCTLYTTCEPCPMCLGAILWARIGTVYYGATQEDALRGGFDDSHFYELIKSNQLPLKQMNHQESATLFDMWLAKSDKKRY